MKNLFVFLLILFILVGCSTAFRSKGEPYSGYSCSESLLHYYSHCVTEPIKKEDFEAKVADCKIDLASKICDKQQADLLWCLGRVEPGTYSQATAACFRWACFGAGSISDGCDCSSYIAKLRECRMKKGIF
jgi:hypothetical protein